MAAVLFMVEYAIVKPMWRSKSESDLTCVSNQIY